jgi:hypothetical protein
MSSVSAVRHRDGLLARSQVERIPVVPVESDQSVVDGDDGDGPAGLVPGALT